MVGSILKDKYKQSYLCKFYGSEAKPTIQCMFLLYACWSHIVYNCCPRVYPPGPVRVPDWVLANTPEIEDGQGHCSVVSSIMSRDRFESITRCLHCVDNNRLEFDRSSPSYDKLGKIKWLFDEIQARRQDIGIWVYTSQ